MSRHYWFKRRRYGWGWTPVSWQGWIVVVGYLTAIFASASYLENSTPSDLEAMPLWFIVLITVATALLVYLSFRNGPAPKWRWGISPDDNPEEDI